METELRHRFILSWPRGEEPCSRKGTADVLYIGPEVLVLLSLEITFVVCTGNHTAEVYKSRLSCIHPVFFISEIRYLTYKRFRSRVSKRIMVAVEVLSQ